MFRRDQLCPGPASCPYVPPASDPVPCDECPPALLDSYLATPAGQLILQTIELDFALQAGVHIGLDDISYPEFLLLRTLTEERNRHREEEMKKATRHGR